MLPSDALLKKLGGTLLIVGLFMTVIGFMPMPILQAVYYPLAAGLKILDVKMLDVTVNVINPHITQEVIAENPTHTIGVGGLLYQRGTLIDLNTHNYVGSARVHLYAKIDSTYLVHPNIGTCSASGEPNGCEWTSEVTYNDGNWGTNFNSKLPTGENNGLEWLYIAADGIYFKTTEKKLWSGNPSGKTLTFFATMWAGDSTFKGRTTDWTVTIQDVACAIPSTYTVTLNGEVTSPGKTYKVTAPLKWIVTPSNNPTGVTRMTLEFTNADPAGNSFGTDFTKSGNAWILTHSPPAGQYTLRIVSNLCNSQTSTVLSMSWDGQNLTIDGGQTQLPLLGIGGIVLMVCGVALFAIGKRREG